jgi:UDP-N-acetyl-D-mannosaminuronate dehydrogenase
VLVVTVAHDDFKNLSLADLQSMVNAQALVADVKHIYNKTDIENAQLHYWSL